jgi:hypothetical protein
MRKLLAIILVLFLVGCGSKYVTEPNSMVDSYEKQYQTGEVNNAQKEPVLENLKLIKNGSATVKTKDVEKSYNNILALVKEFNGYQTNISKDEGKDYLYIRVEFKIPAESLDAYIEKLNELEDVKYLTIKTKDITNEYYDSEIRLAQLEKELSKYQEFFNNAKSVEEMLQIQYEINRVTSEIESIKGQFKLWDSLIDYSTVSLDISEYDDVVHEEEIEFKALSFKDFLYFIKSGFVRTMSGLVSVVQYAIIFVISGIPVWLPVGGIVYYVVKRRKKKNGNK